MISLVNIYDFFSMILPMFEFLLVFAGILFLIHLKIKTDRITEYIRNISSDIAKIAHNTKHDENQDR